MENFKVRCVVGKEGVTTVGKVYELKNGYLPFDDGRISNCSYRDVEDLNKHMLSRFELVLEEPQLGTKTWLMELVKENTIYAERKDGKMFLVSPVGFAMYDYAIEISGYNDNLESVSRIDEKDDIVKVYKSKWLVLQNLTDKDDLELLWQREEDIELQEIVDWLVINDEVTQIVYNLESGKFSFDCLNGRTLEYKNYTLSYAEEDELPSFYSPSSNEELFKKVKELVNEDIDPIEIKEWLEEFTELSIEKSPLGNYVNVIDVHRAYVFYDIENKKINSCDLLEIGVLETKRLDCVFKTHKEALQWLKDNLVKPQKKVTIELTEEQLKLIKESGLL